MDVVALKLLGLVALLIPLVLGLLGLWRARWRDAPASDCLLAALISVPIILIGVIVLLGSLPFGRPLRLLVYVQLALSAAGLWLTWRRRREVGGVLWQAVQGAATGWREALWAQRAALLLGVLTHASATLYGAWNTPWSVDELAYQLPQALQPYQDGFLGKVQSCRVWADSYPRGATLLFYWTIQLTGRDYGVHPVNAAFGWVFMLATYVAAMRSGLGRGWAWLAAGLVPTAPIFWYLSTVGYIDLSVGGALAAMLAFALPERGRSWSWGSAIGMLAAGMLALWMKFPPVVLVLFTFTVRGLSLLLYSLRRWRRHELPALHPGVLGFARAAVAALLLASVPYLRTWALYGSPVYPVRVAIGTTVVFDGPMDTTQFGRMNELPPLQRYAKYWSDWYAPINSDAPGTFGALFTLLVIPSAFVVTLVSIQRRNWSWLLPSLAFWLIVALPEHHVPRYALYALLPGAVMVGRLGELLGAAGWSVATTALVLAFMNLHAIFTYADSHVRWANGFGAPLLTEARNRVVLDRVMADGPGGPAPETRRALYAVMRDGDTLVSAISAFEALLYDPELRYRVEHRPARRWPYGGNRPSDPEYGAADAPGWLAVLLREDVAAVMVYSDSAEDSVLRQNGSGFHMVAEQPAGAGAARIRVYRADR